MKNVTSRSLIFSNNNYTKKHHYSSLFSHFSHSHLPQKNPRQTKHYPLPLLLSSLVPPPANHSQTQLPPNYHHRLVTMHQYRHPMTNHLHRQVLKTTVHKNHQIFLISQSLHTEDSFLPLSTSSSIKNPPLMPTIDHTFQLVTSPTKITLPPSLHDLKSPSAM